MSKVYKSFGKIPNDDKIKQWIESIDFSYLPSDDELLDLYNKAKKSTFKPVEDSSEYPDFSLKIYYLTPTRPIGVRLCHTNMSGIFYCEIDEYDYYSLHHIPYGRILFDNVLRISSKSLERLVKNSNKVEKYHEFME